MNHLSLSPSLEQGSDTQSMLLDDGVSDMQLAEVMVRAHGEELTWLAWVMLLTADPSPPKPGEAARQVVMDALAQVVAHRDRIWKQASLRAWLVKLALQGCGLREQSESRRQRNRRILRRILAPWHRRTSHRAETVGKGELRPALRVAWEKMLRHEQQCLLLHEVLGLTEAEIAYALETELYPVDYWLKESRLKISAALVKNPTPGLLLAKKTDARESPLSSSLRSLWPFAGLSMEDSHLYTTGISSKVETARRWRRGTIAARETLLVGMVLAVLFFTCRAANLLPKEIIHQYKTPTPFIKFARPMLMPTPQAPFYYNYSVQEGDTLESIAQKAGVLPQDILSINRNLNIQDVQGLYAGATLKLPANPAMDWRLTPTPVTPLPPLSPLTLHSDPQAILERIKSSSKTWRTLWMSLQEIVYGPPGYLGPSYSMIGLQIWYSQPGKLRLIGQDASVGSVPSQFFALNGISFSKMSEADPIYAGFSDEGIDFFLSYVLFGMDPILDATLIVLREEQVVGRQALVVQATRTGSPVISRLWVDALTGVILRRLDYNQAAPDIVIQERQVLAIAYDQDFPASIFNPTASSQASFVQDYTGQPLPHGENFPWQPGWPENGHAARPVIPAPQGFDPSGQPVFLQWPESWEQATETPSLRLALTLIPHESAVPGTGSATALPPQPRIDVFASRYYLGSLPMKNVTLNACQRSPDGQKIALSVHSNGDYTPGKLVWFRLQAPIELHILYNFWGDTFAFSPDSRRVAFNACEGVDTCSIHIVELETGNVQSLKPVAEVFSVNWSPDGQFLALFGNSYVPKQEYFILVINLQNGEVIYSRTYDPQSESIPADSPTRDWGMEIPVSPQNAQGCMLPFHYPNPKSK